MKRRPRPKKKGGKRRLVYLYEEDDVLFEEAASADGRSVSGFLREAGKARARRVLKRQKRRDGDA